MPKDSDHLKDPYRILIIGPAWVGDMVMAQALFILLKRENPNCVIDVLAPAWTNPLLARMPEVSESFDMPIGHGQLRLGDRFKLGKQLQNTYQQAIVLPNSLKSALIPWIANIPKRTGWRGEMRFGLLNDIRLLDKKRYPLMVERFLALGLPVAAKLPTDIKPKLVADESRIPDLLSKFQLDRKKSVLALCPGAEFGPAKQWPSAHYAEVAKKKIASGWQVWIMGSEKDEPVAQSIKNELSDLEAENISILAGKTDLSQAIDLMSVSTAVVSNDSGLMHIAAALHRPLVAVYGSTSPDFTPPLADCVSTESIAVDCGPCFQRECPEGHLKCLNDLKPSQVLSGLEKIIVTNKNK
ncbi:MAG: lipopolysaccharide heptosyltransferase II [Cellvibrionaceae bacterium]